MLRSLVGSEMCIRDRLAALSEQERIKREAAVHELQESDMKEVARLHNEMEKMAQQMKEEAEERQTKALQDAAKAAEESEHLVLVACSEEHTCEMQDLKAAHVKQLKGIEADHASNIAELKQTHSLQITAASSQLDSIEQEASHQSKLHQAELEQVRQALNSELSKTQELQLRCAGLVNSEQDWKHMAEMIGEGLQKVVNQLLDPEDKVPDFPKDKVDTCTEPKLTEDWVGKVLEKLEQVVVKHAQTQAQQTELMEWRVMGTEIGSLCNYDDTAVMTPRLAYELVEGQSKDLGVQSQQIQDLQCQLGELEQSSSQRGALADELAEAVGKLKADLEAMKQAQEAAIEQACTERVLGLSELMTEADKSLSQVEVRLKWHDAGALVVSSLQTDQADCLRSGVSRTRELFQDMIEMVTAPRDQVKDSSLADAIGSGDTQDLCPVSCHQKRVASSRHSQPEAFDAVAAGCGKRTISQKLGLVTGMDDGLNSSELKSQLKKSVERERMHLKRISLLETSTDWKNNADEARYQVLLQTPADSFAY
eukprot:TRINITY_DN6989_c0_g2_i2.p1 TRINITY_DN6989_c0_g2~~TRINITY_DN6989_c0_g2_i2.p1  ORF type:complete len:584 (+),score=184.23 TRINITY_DN6989_c0_g2_i2:141-1754(+)